MLYDCFNEEFHWNRIKHLVKLMNAQVWLILDVLYSEQLNRSGSVVLWPPSNAKFVTLILNILSSRPNGCHFPDDIFKWNFLSENAWISIEISLTFVPRGPIDNIPALVQIMAWRRPGDKPLSAPMMVNLLTHICVTRPQLVNSLSWCSKIMTKTQAMATVTGEQIVLHQPQ